MERKSDLKTMSFRLSTEARRLLAALAVDEGTTKTGVLEALIRRAAEQKGIRTQSHRETRSSDKVGERGDDG